MAAKRSTSTPGLIQFQKRSKLGEFKVGRTNLSEIHRTSGLCSPIVRLEDHQGVINSCKFHTLGELVMSAGYDKKIHIRCVYGEGGVAMAMHGHTDTITEVQFSPNGTTVYSCSQDNTVASWDTATGARLKLFEGHKCVVNTVQSSKTSPHVICSGSDDRTVRLWDVRECNSSQVFQSGYQVLTACFNENGDHIITGGVDNDIKIWDIRRNEVVSRLHGHVDMISGIALSPCGSYMLSNSLDNTLRIWDVRPFVPGHRCVDVYTANQYVSECNLLRCTWSKDGKMIAAGSSDHHVYVWDVVNHKLLFKLPGHESSVIDVDFHPEEPIIASGSSNEHLYMHEFLS